MNYIVTQKDVDLLMQSTKELYYKLELLNKDYKILDYIDGNLINDNISIDSTSNVRRTYTCTIYVENSSFILDKSSRIWFDKLVRPKIGIYSQRYREIIWYCLGTFLYTDLNYSYDQSSRTLQLTCLDLMCMLDDSRNGQIPDYKRTILAGTDAREIVISLLKEFGITKYFIEFNLNGTPISTFNIESDKTYESGATAYTIIKDICSLYPGTQMYFDIDGTFIISRIPTGKNEINVLTDEILQPILIDEQINTSTTSVYNHIKIYGKQNSPDYFTRDVTCNNNVYCANVVTYQFDENQAIYVEISYGGKINNLEVFALNVPCTNLSVQYININNVENIPIVNEKGENLPEGLLEPGIDYLFRYRKESNDFLFIGTYQIIGEAYLSNNLNNTDGYAVIQDNDFAVEVIGDRLKVLSGSDYDSISTNSFCNQRARLELYNATNMQETLSISTIAIPWIDVNTKVEFTSNITKRKAEYIITNISCDYSTYQMSISLSRFYPDYI